MLRVAGSKIGSLSAILTMLGAVCSLFGAPYAGARVGLVGLYPGMPIRIAHTQCSLGFLATNLNRDRLGVTAGHCATGPGDTVRSARFNPIGVVILHIPDDVHSNDVNSNSYGVTVMQLTDNTYTSDAYFTKYGDPTPGVVAFKYGSRTNGTKGKILSIENGKMKAEIFAAQGDSGGPWVSHPHGANNLLGIEIAGMSKPFGGAYKYNIGYGIYEIIKMIRHSGAGWVRGFTPAGR